MKDSGRQSAEDPGARPEQAGTLCYLDFACEEETGPAPKQTVAAEKPNGPQPEKLPEVPAVPPKFDIDAVSPDVARTLLLATNQLNDILSVGGGGFANIGSAIVDNSFLEYMERKHFNYFVTQSDKDTGLTKDRSKEGAPSSIAAVGFSLSAHTIASERGWISRDQSADYTLKVLRTLWNSKQGDDPEGCSGKNGFFYHFIDTKTANRAAGCELSTIDTALLMSGVLSSGQYFNADSDKEKEIRDLSDKLYKRVDWNWATKNTDFVSMGWTPESGFLKNDWKGYNEAMILMVLGLGSPTKPLPPKAWDAYTQSYNVISPAGEKFIEFAPMFGHQYSHAWIDFRGIQDAKNRQLGVDYFQNSQRAAHAQRDYAVKNPLGWRCYNGINWGITASDGPGLAIQNDVAGRPFIFHGYRARGAPNDFDDGTLAPTAVAASLPFYPEASLSTMKHWFLTRPELWTNEGFKDAFNPSFTTKDNKAWVASDSIGIDQGPAVLMFENYRTNFVWSLMKQNPYMLAGLKKAGFTGGWLDKTPLRSSQNPVPVPVPAPTPAPKRDN